MGTKKSKRKQALKLGKQQNEQEKKNELSALNIGDVKACR